MTNQEAITKLTNIMHDDHYAWHPSILTTFGMAVDALKVSEVKRDSSDLISRQAAIDAHCELCRCKGVCGGICPDTEVFRLIPSAQPERTWYPATEPPNHHNDVIVRGIEAIGNVTVHKIMQWDVDTWRPTDYAPSITWKEWSEI